MNYLTRENEIRATISKEEAIHRIEKVYHARYDPNHALDIYDQLLACEAVEEASTPEDYFKNYESKKYNENVSVSGNDNDICKRNINFELTDDKLEIINKLNRCNFKTPLFEIINLLKELFLECGSDPKHWVYIAEKWNPKSIKSVLRRMTKLHGARWKTIGNPAAYFTHLIKYHKKKKIHKYQ